MPCKNCKCKGCNAYRKKASEYVKRINEKTNYYSEWYSNNRESVCLNRRKRWELQRAKLGKIPKPYKPRIKSFEDFLDN